MSNIQLTNRCNSLGGQLSSCLQSIKMATITEACSGDLTYSEDNSLSRISNIACYESFADKDLDSMQDHLSSPNCFIGNLKVDNYDYKIMCKLNAGPQVK